MLSMQTDLKITTRRGYTSILESLLLPRFGHLPITHIDSAAASILDLDLSKRRLSQSTRNNAQIVLRSVLRFAASRGILPHSVTNLPRVKPIGQGILEIPTDCNIQTLLTHAVPSHRLAVALMAFAGLRPNEVRALRRRDILLRYYAITSWLRAGIPVHVVQRMAGHHNLATTQRYVHHLKADLEDAAHRLATLTSPASPAP